MKITYIHHSSFAVELPHAVFLFDYFEGTLPDFPKEKPLYVFASHKHQDHFDLKIFSLAEQYPKIRYILSRDIHLSPAYLERHGIPKERLSLVTFIGKEQTRMFRNAEPVSPDKAEPPVQTEPDFPGKNGLSVDQEEPAAESESPVLTVETLTSTDEGVAFLVTCEGVRLYHAGDLNWWTWIGETNEEYEDMKNRFFLEMEKLRGRTFDAAFVPLDPRQEERYYWGFDAFMRTADAKAVFPMHFWGDPSVINKLLADPVSEPYRDRIRKVGREGEEFLI